MSENTEVVDHLKQVLEELEESHLVELTKATALEGLVTQCNELSETKKRVMAEGALHLGPTASFLAEKETVPKQTAEFEASVEMEIAPAVDAGQDLLATMEASHRRIMGRLGAAVGNTNTSGSNSKFSIKRRGTGVGASFLQDGTQTVGATASLAQAVDKLRHTWKAFHCNVVTPTLQYQEAINAANKLGQDRALCSQILAKAGLLASSSGATNEACQGGDFSHLYKTVLEAKEHRERTLRPLLKRCQDKAKELGALGDTWVQMHCTLSVATAALGVDLLGEPPGLTSKSGVGTTSLSTETAATTTTDELALARVQVLQSMAQVERLNSAVKEKKSAFVREHELPSQTATFGGVSGGAAMDAEQEEFGGDFSSLLKRFNEEPGPSVRVKEDHYTSDAFLA